MNPFESPPKKPHPDPYTTVVTVGQNTIAVYGEMVPKYFPLLGQYMISINGAEPFTSKKIRWQEKMEFPLTIDGRIVNAVLTTHRFEFGTQPFRISVDGQPVVEAKVKMKNWWLGFVLGILAGMGIAALLLIAFPLLAMIAHWLYRSVL